jgi:type I restriction enzyme S subunit
MTLTAWPTYDSYKDSGVEWIGDVPDQWLVEPGRQCLYENRDKNTGMKESTVLSLSYGRVIVKDEDKLTGLVPESFETYQVVQPGDIIIRGTDLQNDMTSLRTGLAKDKGIITSAYINLRPKAEINPVFLHYLLHSYDVKKVFYALGSGLRQNLSYDDFKYLRLPIPSPTEQRVIAAFLDEKCAKVDEAVRIKEEQIALLRERRQILVQQAVTRGLNPDAPLQDSGIDWIGQIPAHWEVRRSKYVFTQRKELARKDDIQLSATQSYGVIPQDKFEELVGRRVVKIQTNLEKRKHVEIDDFVISMRSFQGGLERAFATGCIRSSYVILQPLEPLSADFFGYLLKSPRYIKALQATGSFIRDGQDLNFDNFSKVDLFLPPMDEQVAIAAHIKVGCEKIDIGIATKEQQIVALREYRTSLIDATVTGKIKVA